MELFEEKGYTKGLAKSKAAEEALNRLGFGIYINERFRQLFVSCFQNTNAVKNYNKLNKAIIRAGKDGNGSVIVSCVYKDPQTIDRNNEKRHVYIGFENFKVYGDLNDTLIKIVYNYFKIFCSGIRATSSSYRDQQFSDKPVDEVLKMLFDVKEYKNRKPRASGDDEKDKKALLKFKIKENRVKSDKLNKERDLNYYKEKKLKSFN